MATIIKPFVRGRRSSSDLRPRPSRHSCTIIDSNLYDSSRSDIPIGTHLMDCVLSDLIYGVQSRPSIPSCWEDDSDDGVDPLTDMTVSPWDLMAADCRRKPSLRGYDPDPNPGQPDQTDVQVPVPTP